MSKLSIEQQKHNEGARLLNIVMPKILEILSKYEGKKIFKVDGSCISKLNDEIRALSLSLDKRDNCYVHFRSYTNIIELRTRTSFQVGEYTYYNEDYVSIGKVDNENKLIELSNPEAFKDDKRFYSVDIEKESNQYNEAKLKAKEFFDYYDSLDYRVKEQLREDFYKLR